MGLRVIVTFEGLDTVLSNLERYETAFPQNIEQAMAVLGEDALNVMRGATHVRTGTLRSGDTLETSGMGFTLSNYVRYAKFVERGHMTPAGFHTRHGYRPAKRRSHVGPFPFLKPAVEYVEAEIIDRLAAALQEEG